MYRSGIAGDGTAVAQGIDAEEDGAQLLLTTPETDSGGGAGEAQDVSLKFYDFTFFALVHSATTSDKTVETVLIEVHFESWEFIIIICLLLLLIDRSIDILID